MYYHLHKLVNNIIEYRLKSKSFIKNKFKMFLSVRQNKSYCS